MWQWQICIFSHIKKISFLFLHCIMMTPTHPVFWIAWAFLTSFWKTSPIPIHHLSPPPPSPHCTALYITNYVLMTVCVWWSRFWPILWQILLKWCQLSWLIFQKRTQCRHSRIHYCVIWNIAGSSVMLRSTCDVWKLLVAVMHSGYFSMGHSST